MASRKRKIGSIKNELLMKSRESMLSAVQIFNNPNILFKAETFIVLSIISWTYLLHAYYREKKVEYRYHKLVGKTQRRKFDKTKYGAYKHWELERCLNYQGCPIDPVSKDNLIFLIGLRHEIEHQMTTRIDDYMSARFQSCCLNYNHYIKLLFGSDLGIDKHLSFALQFSSITESSFKELKKYSDLPSNIYSYITSFDEKISEDEFNDPRYAYRVMYIPKIVNNKGQADKVIEFIPADSPIADSINRTYRIIKDREKPKFMASEIVAEMKALGFIKFNMHHFVKLWQNMDGKNPSKGYGTMVAKTWYWYETWKEQVRKHCEDPAQNYR